MFPNYYFSHIMNRLGSYDIKISFVKYDVFELYFK
ncbi:hypothetical protein SAMN04488559_12522 [Isobaculum melis]|uniref:Uncharacterized protein n=1 Tax=Isobaculum melis TaxID=142588 RepID=A0A1H9UBC8_9LACT|nr:hypothetical protein SAMN04488559_12522 [Isobaculum melis]